jgi:predicted RNA-binding Zn ribbon-like protein
VLERARNLRSAMYAIFSALAADRRPPNADLELLNVELASAEAHARLVPDGAGYAWGWQGRALDLPLWGVVRSAAEVLTSDQDRRRVRECGGTDCHWLFLDTSKNRTRQWCSMQSCGNREKARRHYRKVRGLCV